MKFNTIKVRMDDYLRLKKLKEKTKYSLSVLICFAIDYLEKKFK